MKTMSPRQAEVLAFIKASIERDGRPPTCAARPSWSSPSADGAAPASSS